VPSPHCDERPGGAEPELVVLHGISLPPGRFGTGLVHALFTGGLEGVGDPELRELEGVRVSSHLLIERDGALTQFVPFDRRAWHAGVSCWNGRAGCNDFSIGIELEGTDHTPYASAQYTALTRVLLALFAAYPGLGPRRIAGHCDVAPGRKTDPGPAFDWGRLHAALRNDPGGARRA